MSWMDILKYDKKDVGRHFGTPKEKIEKALEEVEVVVEEFRGILKSNELNDSNANLLVSGMLRLDNVKRILYSMSINPNIE
tara:strand:+ start:249 stop:491 length:243 start_codon:yes stop_codon:yes gene_type:complete